MTKAPLKAQVLEEGRELIVSAGTMSELVRAYPWSESPLGPIASWSDSLLSTINVLLCSQYPSMLYWGPQLHFFYNDAVTALFGELPPEFGQPPSVIFGKAWDVLCPQIEACLLSEKPQLCEGIQISLDGVSDAEAWNYHLLPIYEYGHPVGVRSVHQEASELRTLGAARETTDAHTTGDEHLAQVLEATSDGIMSIDADWTITYMNRRAQEMLGAVGSVIGKNAWTSFPEAIYHGSPYVECYERTMYQRIPAQFEAQYPAPLNLSVCVQVRPSHHGIVLFVQDNTQQKLLDEALLRSDERLRLAQEAGNCASWEWDLVSGRFEWSGDVTAIYGRPATELNNVDRIVTFIHEDDRQGTMDAVYKAIIERSEYQYEFRVVWPDGSVHWIFGRGRPVIMNGETDKRMYGVNIDITEKKTAEQELRLAQVRLAELFEQAPAFIAVHSGPDHVYEMVNQSYRDLIGPREVLGIAYNEAIPELQRQGGTAILDRVYQTGITDVQTHAYFLMHSVPDQPPRRVCLSYVLQPRRESDGRISGVIAVGIDVTEQVEAEQALVENEKLAAVGRLASSIAHEIRDPLGSVRNLLYLAKMLEDPADVREHLDMAEHELDRAIVISTQTLLSQKHSTMLNLISFSELADSVLSLYNARLRDSNITVERSDRMQHPMVCSEGEIRQVLGNLIANAC